MGFGQYSDNGIRRGDLEANNRPRGRVREVFGSHDQLCHVWANQWETIPYGRSSDGRMFFRDGTLYSYGDHFPIASFRRNKAGTEYLLFTTGSYSVSTSKHMSIARRAIGYTRPNLFHVSKAVLQAYSRELADRAKADYEQRIHLSLEKAPRRRGDNVQRELGRAAELAAEANKFAEVIGARWRIKLPETGPELLAYAQGESDRKKARDKKDAAKRKAEQKRQARQWLEEWKAGQPPAVQVPLHVHAYMTPAERELLDSLIASAVTRWRSGQISSYQLPEQYRRIEGAMLRLSPDRETIQTSAGAEFPTEHGTKAWPILKRIVSREGEGTLWERNGHFIHLGHFQVNKIVRRIGTKDDVTIIAGCHHVAWAEVAAIAKQLGLE